MSKTKDSFISQSDKKYICTLLYNINDGDILFGYKIKSSLVLFIKMFIEMDVVWITSDNRLKLTRKGTTVLQDLLVSFVDFTPKTIKFYYTKYE